MFRLYILLATLITGTVPVRAQQHQKQIDTLLNSFVQARQFNGNVLVVEKNNALFEKCYGFADREHSIPNEPPTRFRIASITKQFTAVLILQLVEKGRLDLSSASRSKMMQAYMNQYGYGIGITKFTPPELNNEVRFAFHQGAINGFRSFMTYIINEDRLIILLCNNFDIDLNPINNGIFSILHNQPYKVAEMSN